MPAGAQKEEPNKTPWGNALIQARLKGRLRVRVFIVTEQRNTPDSLRDENKYLERVFIKNNYNADFIRRNIFRPTEANATNKNRTPVTTIIRPH